MSRFRFRAAPYIHGFFALAILIPTVSMLPMTFRLFNALGLLGTKYGIAMVYATEQLPVTVFLLVTFMRDIPAELDEAALIDGCGLGGLFFRVVLPLSRNGIVTVLILAFVAVWNDYLTALVLLPDPDHRTLSLALAFAKGEYFVDYGMMSAALVFAIAPMIVVYLFLKDLLIAGLASGAVKG
jgi:raffinose/stachyose/melibiose transport system permease protein